MGQEEQISITIPALWVFLVGMKGCALAFFKSAFSTCMVFSIHPEFSVMLKQLFNFPGNVKDFAWAHIELYPPQEHCAWGKTCDVSEHQTGGFTGEGCFRFAHTTGLL